MALVYAMAPDTFGAAPAQASQYILRKVPRTKPHPIPRPISPAVASLTRRSLANIDSVQWNLSALLQQAVREGRIGDIEKLALQQRYSAIPGRGDFALLECLKIQSCDLNLFPALATAVGRNQLHLQHAARCHGCNKINVFKLSGNTVEGLMHSFYQRGGWKQLPGEIGNSGIDGLYYKIRPNGEVFDVLVTEAKYNQSSLQPRRSGMQMSKQWILDNLGRLTDRAVQEQKPELQSLYRQVTRFVEQDVYRSQLWHMNVDNERLFIWRQQILSKDRTVIRDAIIGEAPWNPRPVHEIDMLSPASDFDRQILRDYNAMVVRGGGR